MKNIATRSLIVILSLVAGILSAQEASGPRIEVAQERYDMGSIAQGEQAVHVFEIRNAGDAPLVIESVQPS